MSDRKSSRVSTTRRSGEEVNMRTQYDIHTKDLYTRESIEAIISEQCTKKNYPIPNFGHGYLSNVAKDMGIEPRGKYGHSYYYAGQDVIPLVNKVLENRAKKKGETKLRTKTSPSKRPMAHKPSQISIDDLSRENNLELLRDKLSECINLINSILEE